jgi:hypothetical protein
MIIPFALMGPFTAPPALRFHRRELSLPLGIGYFFQSKVLILSLFYALFQALSSVGTAGEKTFASLGAFQKDFVPRRQKPVAKHKTSEKSVCVFRGLPQAFLRIISVRLT